MFYGCSKLKNSPILPAATLKSNCYYYLFYSCPMLENIVCLATNISASNCVSYWVNSVSSTGTFYKAPSMASWSRGTSGIPSNWTIVDYIEE